MFESKIQAQKAIEIMHNSRTMEVNVIVSYLNKFC